MPARSSDISNPFALTKFGEKIGNYTNRKYRHGYNERTLILFIKFDRYFLLALSYFLMSACVYLGDIESSLWYILSLPEDCTKEYKSRRYEQSVNMWLVIMVRISYN